MSPNIHPELDLVVAMLDLEVSYDPFGPALHKDRYPVYEVSSDRCPLYRAKNSDTWVLSAYSDVEAALPDPGIYSSARGIVDLAAVTRLRSGPVRGYASLPITWTNTPVDASEKGTR